MKTALHKSAIPPSHIFVIKHLEEKHFDPVWHAHSEYQLFVVLEGTGTRFIGDGIRSFKPGELVLTGPHLPHLWRSDETYFEKNSSYKTSGIVIYLNENFLGEHILEKEEMLSLVNKNSQPTKFLLKINCRNTKQVGEETSLISGFEKPPFLLEHLEGIPVEYIFYKDETDQKKLLGEQLKKLSDRPCRKH